MKLSTEAMVAMPVTLQTGMKGHPDYPSSVCGVHHCLVYFKLLWSIFMNNQTVIGWKGLGFMDTLIVSKVTKVCLWGIYM